MDIKKVTLTRYSVIVNGSDAKKAIKPMQKASAESMFIDVFDDNSAVICCATFSDARNCLAILKDSGCSSATVILERVYNECNSRVIKSAYCILNTVEEKGMKDYRNQLEHGVKEQLYKMGLSDYAFAKWVNEKRYKEVFGFLVALESSCIANGDYEAEQVFHQASIEINSLM